MFNPLYIEIYQAAVYLFAAGVLLHAFLTLRNTRKENARLSQALNEAWSRIRLAQLQMAKLEYPEDWELRGVTAEFEGKAGPSHLAGVYRRGAAQALNNLSDEQLADIVLETVRVRLDRFGVNDKVFTRLAGRTFRAVEAHRKQRTVNS